MDAEISMTVGHSDEFECMLGELYVDGNLIAFIPLRPGSDNPEVLLLLEPNNPESKQVQTSCRALIAALTGAIHHASSIPTE